MIVQEKNTQNSKFYDSQKQHMFSPYRTQGFGKTVRDFNNVYSSPTYRLQQKTKNPLIAFNKSANKTFFSFQQKTMSSSRMKMNIKNQKDDSKSIFRQTFSISKTYQTEKDNSVNVRPPTGVNFLNYRPATRIRKINNIGQESNNNFLVKYEIIKQLGKGMYGTVHLAKQKQNCNKNQDQQKLKNKQLSSPSSIFGNRQRDQQFQIGKYQTLNNLATIQVTNIQPEQNRIDQNNQENQQNYNQKQIKQSQISQQNLVAIKVYQKFKMNKDPSKFKNIRREINIMQNLNHEGIIKFYESVQSLTKMSLVVQYGGQISLLDYLKKNYPLKQAKIKAFAKQLLDVLIYLHEKNIVHRDIKLQNILVKSKSSQDQTQQQIKLIDFGFSTLTHRDRKLNIICGTPNFMAPQLLNNKQYIGQKADIWSFGVVIFTLAEGRLPFKTDTYQQLQVLANKGKISFKKNHSKAFQNFIKGVLKVKSQQRPRAIDLLKFQWIQS